MKEDLANYIKQNKLFAKQDKLLLAISAGADSVALSHLLKELGYNISLANCNFGLRNEQSDADEFFVAELAKKWNVNCFTKKFKTKAFAKQKKISIQMAARELRYNWFEQIRVENKFDFVVTAHHKDDDLETFFINLIRGTSIKGLLGISSKTAKVVRPLLFANKQEIRDYLQQNKIQFREDSSNKEEKYLRNKIRLKLMPLLQEMNPSISETIMNEKDYLSGVSEIYFSAIETASNRLVKQEKDFFTISIEQLKKLDVIEPYLYEFLKPFGFANVSDILQAIQGQSGKQFYSATHRLTIDRKQIIIQKNTENEKVSISIIKTDTQIEFPLKLKLEVSNNPSIKKDKNIAVFDYQKLQFPLILRRWEKGDFFTPIGMKGKKKLSDFFIDNKIPIPVKENIWVLSSATEIIWVVGHRIADKFKVVETTKKAYIAQLLKS